MSASEGRALDAIAFQLLAALEEYDQDTARMIAGWPELDLYRSVSDQMEKIRLYSSAVAEATVQSLELLIAHAELVHLLWRAEYAGDRTSLEALEEVREHHADCVAALRNRCLRVMHSRA
jgi:hypothetical protein